MTHSGPYRTPAEHPPFLAEAAPEPPSPCYCLWCAGLLGKPTTLYLRDDTAKHAWKTDPAKPKAQGDYK